MFWKAAAVCYSAALLSRAQPDGPIPRLNSNPRDTSNPRLVGKHWPYDEVPYQVDTVPNSVPPDPTYRGPQFGYNQCNDSTYGPESRCQTLIVNSLQDFCLFAPHKMDPVGTAEPSVVAYCTQPTHGTRLIPPGTLKGAQFIRTPSYIEFTGIIDQTFINIPENDGGGEVDSGGQDARGNPIGGFVYSNNMPSTPGVMTHARMWHEFIGSNMFCMKFCDETAPNASGLCRHTLDTLGCFTNVPASYREGVFLSCEGEDQAPVQQGVTAIPASSNCQTFQSTDIWPVASTSTSTTASSTSTPGGGSGGGSGTTTSGGSSATQTGGGDAAGLRAPLEFTGGIFAVAALIVGAIMI